MGSRETRASGAATAYEHIKRMILVGVLAPGHELREAQLVAQTGFGRTPVREALGRLVVEGLVEVRPRQGYRVALVTLESVRSLFEMRQLLEPAAVELAVARATDEQLSQLRDLASRTYDADDRGSYEQFLSDNRELHVGIARLAGNDRLVRAFAPLLEELQRLFYVSFDGTSEAVEQLHEHTDLFDAIVERDAPRARAICEEQIAASRDRILGYFLESAHRPIGNAGGFVLLGGDSAATQ